MGPKSVDIIQQGDVGLRRVGALPEGAKKLGHRILATGEATGHAHKFLEKTVELHERDGVLYAVVPENTKGTLAHNTHGNVVADPGVWEYVPAREKDHLADIERRVVD